MTAYKIQDEVIQLHGNGLFSKEEVTVSISKAEKGTGISFVLNNQIIQADIKNVSNANRNTVLTNGVENICLVEHFLATCSLLGINDIEVITNKNELIFGDGSALHWYEAFIKAGYSSSVIQLKYDLNETLFIKGDKKEIAAIPHDGFKVSYLLDWDHPALGKKWASWQIDDGVNKLIRARSFATKEENDFFGASDYLLTLDKEGFNKNLYEPLEPLYHKMLDIVGDLRLCGINPLEINMHVIGIKSGHEINVELAHKLKSML